jgi:hypothetical protein
MKCSVCGSVSEIGRRRNDKLGEPGASCPDWASWPRLPYKYAQFHWRFRTLDFIPAKFFNP